MCFLSLLHWQTDFFPQRHLGGLKSSIGKIYNWLIFPLIYNLESICIMRLYKYFLSIVHITFIFL